MDAIGTQHIVKVNVGVRKLALERNLVSRYVRVARATEKTVKYIDEANSSSLFRGISLRIKSYNNQRNAVKLSKNANVLLQILTEPKKGFGAISKATADKLSNLKTQVCKNMDYCIQNDRIF